MNTRVKESGGDYSKTLYIQQEVSPPHVLIVDDEPLIRGLVASILKHRGYRVYEAGSGASALEVLKECGATMDLLITDIVMPHMNGVELASLVENLHPRIKTLYMSGFIPDYVDCVEDVSFILKPFKVEELLGKVQETLLQLK